MAIRILTKNGIENTNIDGARDNNFNSGRRSGIIKGALKEGNLYGTSNSLTLEPCELRLCGHRVVIDENENKTFTNKPQNATKQSLIAQIQVDNENVVFELIVQNSFTALVQDNLDINGNGTYQLQIGTFIQNTDGTISDVIRTAELISGSAVVENLANKNASNIDVAVWQTKLNTKIYAHYISAYDVGIFIITDNNTPFTYSTLARYLYDNGFRDALTSGMVANGPSSSGTFWFSIYKVASSNGTEIQQYKSNGGTIGTSTIDSSRTFSDIVVAIN